MALAPGAGMHIPFETTIAGAYRFGFTRLLAVIGAVWFPILLMTAVLGGMFYMLAPAFADFFQHLPEKAQPVDSARVEAIMRAVWTAEAVAIPVFMVFSAMARVGVMRVALDQDDAPRFIFFSLGGQVWRLIGAYLLLFLAFYALGIAFVLGGVAVWFGLHATAPGIAALLLTIGGIAAGCFLIYAFVRTYFFLPAIVVAEGSLGLARSWALGRGNFWRIVGIVLVVYLPVSFVVGTVNSTIMQITIMPEVMRHAGAAQTPEQMQAMIRAILAAAVRFLPYFGALQIVQLILFFGIDGGAVATAYKAVTNPASAA